MTRFTAVAKGLGFTIPGNTESLCEVVPGRNEFPLFHPEKKADFDIHWAVTRPLLEAPIDEDKLWEWAEPINVAGSSCLSFRLEDHLLYLC